MAENRAKRSQTKSSLSKEHQNWNISPTMHTSAAQSSEAIKSAKTSAIDSLFDSGYDSQTVSKTSIDLEADFDQKMSISSHNSSQLDQISTKKFDSKKWTDSGLGITDSGLNIDEDFDEQIDKNIIESGRSGDSVSIKLLKEAYQPDQDGDTYLHLSIIEGLTDVSYALIRIVPHPDFFDIFNHLIQSPLHLAALTRQSDIVRRLVISGATVDLRDRHGNTALHIACANSDLDTVYKIIAPISEKELKSAQVVNYRIGAQHLPTELLEIRNYEGETCIHLATYNKNKNIIEFLVKSGANINAQEGKSGKSVLHWSVENQSPDLVQFLVSRCRADVNVRNYAGHTPLHLAWMLSNMFTNSKLKAIIKYLRENGAEPSQLPNFDSDSDSDSLSGED